MQHEFNGEQNISFQTKVLQNLLVIFESVVLNRFLLDSWADLNSLEGERETHNDQQAIQTTITTTGVRTVCIVQYGFHFMYAQCKSKIMKKKPIEKEMKNYE